MAAWTWERLRRDHLTTPLLLRSIPVGIIILTGIVATAWNHDLLADHQDLVVHTYQAIDTTKDVLIALDDAETGQRGYLLSGDRRYLDPYEKALDRLVHLRSALAEKVSDNAQQVAEVERLGALIDVKLGELKDSITLHDTQGFDAARDREVALMERATMDAIRRVIGDITEAEKTLLEARADEVDTDENRIRVVAILVGLASLLTRTAVELYLTRKGLDVRIVTREPS